MAIKLCIFVRPVATRIRLDASYRAETSERAAGVVDFRLLIVHYLTWAFRTVVVLEDHLRKLTLSKLLMLAVVASGPRVHAGAESPPAQSHKLVYVVRLSGEGNLVRGYTLHLRLYSRATQRSQQATAYCDICVTDRMAKIASDFALRPIGLTSAQVLTRDEYSRTAVGTTSLAIGGALALVGGSLLIAEPNPRRAVLVASTGNGISVRF